MRDKESGEKETEISDVSAAREGFGGGTVAGIICGEATRKDGAFVRRLGRGGREDSREACLDLVLESSDFMRSSGSLFGCVCAENRTLT